MFAIIEVAGKQYKVIPGDVIEVDKIEGEEGTKVNLESVLLLKAEKGEVEVGQPVLRGAKVTAKIVKQGKGDKIEVRRYKSKVRYRRQRGFRPFLTTLSIEKIAHA